MPTLDPDATGFTNNGYGSWTRATSAADRHDGEVGRRHSEAAHDVLGDPLVERQREDEPVGEGVRDLERVKQCGHLRFAREAEHALGVVEDQVPSIAGGQPGGERLDAADAIDRMSERPQRRLDGVDRFGRIELGGVFFAIPLPQIVVAEVVGEPDAHGYGCGSGKRNTWPS